MDDLSGSYDHGAQVKMHAGEIDIDIALVRRLLADQFPGLAERMISTVRSTGTVNAIYRLGDDLCLRLPRVGAWSQSINTEWAWLPKIAPHISLTIPEPIARGKPTTWYPYPWAIYGWIEAAEYREDLVADERQAARDLVDFVLELRSIDRRGAPRGGRDPLIELDEETRAAIEASQNVIDAEAATSAWLHSLEGRPWDGRVEWIHGDLLRSNLLVRDGRICAVIDFGGVGVGDPAADVVSAWSIFSQAGRAAFREALAVEDDTWRRARGYALHQALMIIPYYPVTNPDFVSQARRTVKEILEDKDYDHY